jgi:hypothetical protein
VCGWLSKDCISLVGVWVGWIVWLSLVIIGWVYSGWPG